MERPIQHLHSLELSRDRNPTPCNDTPLDRTAVEFRLQRDAAFIFIHEKGEHFVDVALFNFSS